MTNWYAKVPEIASRILRLGRLRAGDAGARTASRRTSGASDASDAIRARLQAAARASSRPRMLRSSGLRSAFDQAAAPL